MNIFNLFKRNNDNKDNVIIDNDDYTLSRHFNSVVNEHTALCLSTVYRCVEILSNSVAQLPLYPYNVLNNSKRLMYEHPVYQLFAVQPNRRQTRFMFLKLLVQNMLLKGNAYALIERDLSNKPIALHYIPSDFVSVIQPVTIFEDVKYVVAGISQVVEHKDIIHIINYPDADGVRGVSTIYYANNSLSISSNSEEAANEHLNSNVSGLLSVESALSAQQVKDAKKAWENNVKNAGGIAVLSGGWKFQTVSMNAKDAQLIESREFNSVDVARWFGVPTTKLGINKGVSYNGIEAEQLAFLTDTLQPLLQKIEGEFESKLLTDNERLTTDIRFDISNFLRTDIKSKSEVYRTLFNIGVMTINEIRNELDLQSIEGGDTTYMQVNMTTLNNISNQNNDNDKQQ